MADETARKARMPSAEKEDAISVIADRAGTPPGPQPPRLGLGLALVLAGGLVGWGAASLGTESSPPTPAETDAVAAAEPIVPRDSRPEPTVTWTEANLTPGIPAGSEYAGTSPAVELDGTLYMTVSTSDPTTGEVASSLWQSPDGLEWVTEEFAVGEPVVASHLTVADGGLYLTGQVANQPALFRSVPGRAIDGSSWTRLELEGAIAMDLRLITTQVDGTGDAITVAVGLYDIWRDLLQPLVPDDIDLTDPSFVLRDDGTLFRTGTRNGVEFGEPIEVLSEEPEVVVTDDSVWVRLVTTDGTEVLESVPLPDGAHPLVAEPPLTSIPLAMVWRSSEDGKFLQVTSRSVLPDGFFAAHPWGDRLLAATLEPGSGFAGAERVTLWNSASGRAWRPVEPQPPPACLPYSLAVSGIRIHLTAEDGTQCVRSGDSGWEVLAGKSEVDYVAGGPAGFIGYPSAFEGDVAQFSRDGIVWADIEMPGLAPYHTVSILDDLLIALSVGASQPNQPTPVQIWVGEIG